MGDYWIVYAGFFLVLIMFLQQLQIQYRTDEKWEKTAAFYRWQVRLAIVVGGAIFLILSTIVVFMPLFASDNPNLGYEVFLQPNKGGAVLVLITIFAGTIRLFFERVADDQSSFSEFIREFFQSFFNPKSLREQNEDISFANESGGARHDSWLWWFLLANIVAFLLIYLESGNANTENIEGSQGGNQQLYPWRIILAFIVNIVAFVGYFSWIYIGIYNKMTRVHHFSGRAVRLFLGNIWESRVPQQVIVTGPVDSGKTAFIEAGLHDPRGGSGRTTNVVAKTIPFRTCEVTAIDSPGENLGDHLMFASRYRADTLVLVLDLDAFDFSADDSQLMKVDTCHQLAKDEDSFTGRYLRALAAATRRDDKLMDPKHIFKARSFLLFLNSKDKPKALDKLPKYSDLLGLSESIGSRFGVENANCQVVAGEAVLANSGRELLDLEPVKRPAKAIWPEGPSENEVDTTTESPPPLEEVNGED